MVHIAMAPKPLMRYRIYGGNQSAVLAGVYDKESYYQKRIAPQYEFLKQVSQRFSENKEVQTAWQWYKARKEYFHHPSLKDARAILKQSKNNKWSSYFEILLPFMPKQVFEGVIEAVKGGRL